MTHGAILLVEDNPSDIGLTKRAVTKKNIANPLVVVQDGQEALDYLFCTGQFSSRDSLIMPAFVLLDLKLPRIDGLEVLRRVRAEQVTRWSPVVVLTASGEEEDLRASYAAGANAYLRKPVDFDRFVEAARTICTFWLALNEPPPAGKVAR